MFERIEVLGVPIDRVNMEQSIDWVDQTITGDKPEVIYSLNSEIVVMAQNNPLFLNLLRDGGLLIPDGIGVIVAAKWLGLGLLEQVPGCELMPAICESAARKGYSIFLFGAAPDVNVKAQEVLRERFPGICIAGARDGYVKDEEMPQLINEINSSGAQVLFVALGCPRQELWVEKYLPLLNVKVCQVVGGTFDVIAGTVKRAPLIFRKMNLEWFYRLASQPKRIFRQTALIKFVSQVARKRLGLF
ncbi:WecB/TagA/CpsF family glycosyltransferase [Sulfurirhabdus autotrophica]|uniref:N-acetylglucosaminyldiphosphoundecaprenol N-acetyl-beta-D-mannosaminyltransferase n=1 Tax=Sulfurirhabdus autotrophica TaxID=1706046 RepID=A0A4R3XWN2_9PROT|nr:WecB/TagA/CpsF family glycosyltransferase [Sulfurirhabdus autotrophica]TCV83442.1 N-acetylglucosaminyldiphosphoundecaprenol N-acetyl-beta-D-mannosaminyltransferase [Sulfurirhabdus autotrophica]